MELEVIKNEEKRMNTIMFLFCAVIPVVAFLFVVLFNHGSYKDSIVFSMIVCSFIVRALQRKLGKYAKYLYISIIPALGAVTLVMGTPGAFGAMALAYFLVIILAIPYYDLSVIQVCAVVTIIVNGLAMILFPKSYLVLYTLPVWIFTMLVYILGTLVAVLIVQRARKLFYDVEEKEREAEEMVGKVRKAFEGVQQSSQRIYESLHNFEESATEIASSTEEISGNAHTQIEEVSDSIGIFNDLNDKIEQSEQYVNATIVNMSHLKDKNNSGISAITELSEKFDENIKSTREVSEEMKELSAVLSK